jgi:DNA-binding NtrC family response regulator
VSIKTVLVADADSDLRSALRAALVDKGYDATEVATADGARVFLHVTADTYVAVLDERLDASPTMPSTQMLSAWCSCVRQSATHSCVFTPASSC